jgi:hypothetical protein
MTDVYAKYDVDENKRCFSFRALSASRINLAFSTRHREDFGRYCSLVFFVFFFSLFSFLFLFFF